MTKREISIVVPVLNNIPALDKCLEHIYRNTAPHVYNLIIVANDSDDDTRQWLVRRNLGCMLESTTVVLKTGKSTYAKNINIGLKLVDTPYVAIVNQDVCVHTYWLDYLLGVLKSNPKLGWVSTTQEKYKYGDNSVPINTSFSISSSLLSMEAVYKIGYLDEEYIRGFEDDDWYMRFIVNGYKPHGVRNVVASHLHSGGYDYCRNKDEMYLKSKELFYNKWGMKDAHLYDVPHIAVVNDIHDWMRCNAAGRVLDVGSGKGHTFGDYAVNLDNIEHQAPNFILGDAESLHFKDNSFETVALGEILEHVDNPVTVLKEASRIGKRVLITVPDDLNMRGQHISPLEEGIYDSLQFHNTPEYRGQIYRWKVHDAASPRSNDKKTLFHARHYTTDMLKDHLNSAGLEYNIDYKKLADWVGWLVIANKR